VLAVAHGSARAAQLARGARVERVGSRAALVTESETPAPLEIMLPGHAVSRAVEIEAWVEEAPPTSWPSGRRTCVVDADAVGAAAVLRAAHAGERFQPIGLAGTKTVFDALAECGVPSSQRSRQLVLAANDSCALPSGTPWWVLGYRIDGRVRVTSRTRRFLWIAATGPTP
jgi:tRNA(Ile)-lysidine synthase